MTKNVLLVGLEYENSEIPGVYIETLGLCDPKHDEHHAAYALYEYDLIIINPVSYSHFIFGKAGKFSDLDSELRQLKGESELYDIDTIFNHRERSRELTVAFNSGAKVIWLLADPKNESFFGWRKTHCAYVNVEVEKVVGSSGILQKKIRQLVIEDLSHKFADYFKQIKSDGQVKYCIEMPTDTHTSIASTPGGYSLGLEIKVGDHVGWLLTPPRTEEGILKLITCALELNNRTLEESMADISNEKYQGIFLSHTSDDKPFVRNLKKSLQSHGVKDVWLDEAEIQIGDSLTTKIGEALEKTKYIGVVLSPRSIKSFWVQKELEIAMNREISSGEVVVLPLVYEHCDLPPFLHGKLYADFSNTDEYDNSLKKLLKRLKA